MTDGAWPAPPCIPRTSTAARTLRLDHRVTALGSGKALFRAVDRVNGDEPVGDRRHVGRHLGQGHPSAARAKPSPNAFTALGNGKFLFSANGRDQRHRAVGDRRHVGRPPPWSRRTSTAARVPPRRNTSPRSATASSCSRPMIRPTATNSGDKGGATAKRHPGQGHQKRQTARRPQKFTALGNGKVVFAASGEHTAPSCG